MAALSELETRTRPFAYYSLISRSLLNLCVFFLFLSFFFLLLLHQLSNAHRGSAIRHSTCTRVQPMDDTPAGVYNYCSQVGQVGQVGQSVGRSVGVPLPAFFFHAGSLPESFC